MKSQNPDLVNLGTRPCRKSTNLSTNWRTLIKLHLVHELCCSMGLVGLGKTMCRLFEPLRSEKVFEVRFEGMGIVFKLKWCFSETFKWRYWLGMIRTYTLRWCIWFLEASPVYTAILMSKPANEPTQYDESFKTNYIYYLHLFTSIYIIYNSAT